MSKVEYYSKNVKLENLEDFRDIEKFLEYCKSCQAYNVVYSCPPFEDDVSTYLDDYKFSNLVAAKISFSEEEKKIYVGKDKVRAYSSEIIISVKNSLHNRMLKIEGEIENSLYLAMGSCKECSPCERVKNRPCAHPERMRRSSESVGYDIGAILDNYFDIEMQWSVDKLPDHYVLFCMLCSKEKVNIEDKLV